MERYEILSPGATKMLFELYEEQVRHRIELEKIIVKGDNRRASIGQILSFILVMVVLSGGVILLFRGKDGVGFASIITALATLLVAFFGGAFLRKRERSEVGLRE
jgi:ABC-type uncharacterized transport system permease subunit